jgi:putative Ca2+/H+ antiporter (TMEM165/GDT1 family)
VASPGRIIGKLAPRAVLDIVSGAFILQFGDKGQFVLMATAARTDMGFFAAAGGWIGVMIACLPAILLRRQLAENIPIVPIRYAGGAAFLLIGIILALGAWGIF